MDIGLIILMIVFVGVCSFVIYDNRTRYSRKSLKNKVSTPNLEGADPATEDSYSSDLMSAVTKIIEDPIRKEKEMPTFQSKDKYDNVEDAIDDIYLNKEEKNFIYQSYHDDENLVKNFIEGNERALEILILRHKPRILNFIYSKVLDRDVADDIFQDTFIKVIHILRFGSYNEEDKFLPWTMRIAHNLIIDFFRKEKEMPTFKNTDESDIFSVLNDISLSAERKILKNQYYEDIKNLIEELPVDQRDVLRMKIFEDMSYKEISERTNVSLNTALARMRYALINLRKLMNKKNIVK